MRPLGIIAMNGLVLGWGWGMVGELLWGLLGLICRGRSWQPYRTMPSRSCGRGSRVGGGGGWGVGAAMGVVSGASGGWGGPLCLPPVLVLLAHHGRDVFTPLLPGSHDCREPAEGTKKGV